MDNIKAEIIRFLKKQTGLEDINLEIPPNSNFGDYAFPCFPLARIMKRSPADIARDIAAKFKSSEHIKEAKATGPYINFFIDKQNLAQGIIKNILSGNFGRNKDKKKTYMIEYFHANTHKGVHIGHIRNISFSESLCRILEADGYKIIRVNYQGDIGPHVAKCIWGYLNLGEKEPKEKKGIWLGKIYAKASEKAKNDDKINEEIRVINNKIYAKDKEYYKVWKKTRQYCLDDFEGFYKEFGVKFDRLYFESQAEEPGKKVVKGMLKKGIAEISEGAVIIDLKEDNLGVFVLLTRDGNALYSTKDLGLAELKQKEFEFDKSIHITGAEQVLHFQQLFKTFEKNNSPMAKKSIHIAYGLVMLPEGKMSSREGTMILYDELKERLFLTAKKAIKQRHPKLSQKELDERTRKIAYAALKFSMVNRENNKDFVFDWDKALAFEGETGPYLQYTYARINSILRKYGKSLGRYDASLLKEPQEQEIVKMLSNFENTIEKASKNLKAIILARYLIDLAQLFNNFYHSVAVLKAEEESKKARLALITAVKEVLNKGLYILGIEVLEKM